MDAGPRSMRQACLPGRAEVDKATMLSPLVLARKLPTWNRASLQQTAEEEEVEVEEWDVRNRLIDQYSRREGRG